MGSISHYTYMYKAKANICPGPVYVNWHCLLFWTFWLCLFDTLENKTWYDVCVFSNWTEKEQNVPVIDSCLDGTKGRTFMATQGHHTTWLAVCLNCKQFSTSQLKIKYMYKVHMHNILYTCYLLLSYDNVMFCQGPWGQKFWLNHEATLNK